MSVKLLAGVMACLFVATSVAQGTIITQWTFPSSATLTTATTVDPNAAAAPLGKGASTNAPTFTNDFYATKPVMSVSRSNDTFSQVYFETTVTANPGFELNMDSWTFDGAAGGGAVGDRTYEVHSSVAGLARNADISPAPPTSLASGPFTTIRGSAGGAGAMQNISADLSSAAYDHLSSLTMRVYFTTLTTNQNIDVDNITFNGAVVPTPEPASISGGLVLAVGILVRHRKR